MWPLLLVVVASAADDEGGCPARCNCLKYLGKFGLNRFHTKCKSCKGTYKDLFWGDTCETPCTEYLDDDNPSEGTKVGRGNCDGCDFDGECRRCKDGFFNENNVCGSDCPTNCLDPSTATHKCSESGSCYGCKPKFCNMAAGCIGDCPAHCLNEKACNIATCTCSTCEMGFWGPACGEPCHEKGCQHCDKESGRCLACMPTYYALSEGCKKCSVNCAFEACNDDGTCKRGCVEKQYFGNFCETPCPKNCKGGRCEQPDGKCACEPGTFGPDCSSTCPTGCQDNVCDQISGKCTCTPGLWGQVCPEGGICQGECDQDCSENCNGGVCKKETGECECKRGFWGGDCTQTCNSHCLTGKCDKAKGTCTGCENGYWGARCEHTCDRHCRGGTCAQADKMCKCEQGKWGLLNDANEACTKDCASGCKLDAGLSRKGSAKARCDKGSGQCGVCKPAFWGKFCESPCADKCMESRHYTNGKCDRSDGSCTCQVGFWGDMCAPCPSDCKTPQCDGETGECIDGCMPGKWGTEPDCEKKCPEHCLQGECDKKSGECPACELGWWGAQCTSPCPPNTGENFGCQQEDGTSHKCKPGWFGKSCDQRCPTHCSGGEEGVGGHCKQFALKEYPLGFCYECEGDKYMNPDCGTECPEHCAGGKCTMSGQCFDCNPGWHGDSCEKRCPTNCAGACNKKTGVCTDCVKGHWGDNCEGECDKRCGTCKGSGHDRCDSCDDAAELCLPGSTGMFGGRTCEKGQGRSWTGKCKCLEGSTRYSKSSPLIILGQVIKKVEKCYCDVQGSNTGMHWVHDDFGSGVYKCYPSCPQFMSNSHGRCYPNEVHVQLAKGPASEGRCPKLERKPQYEINFDPPLCLDVESAMIVYSFDKSVVPEPSSSSKPIPPELCADKPGKAKITSLCLPEKYKEFMVEKAQADTGRAILTI